MPRNDMYYRVNHWINNHYGSRRAFVRSWWHRLLCQFRRYHDYQRVDWDLVERLVFVCKGNICRSVYAEAVAKSLGAESTSCGIDTTNGVSAHKDAVSAAKYKGFDLRKHEARSIQSMVFKEGDLFIAMEPWHLDYLQRTFGSGYQCTLLGLWAKPAMPYIHDPYGNSMAYYDNCFSLIGVSVKAITGQLRKERMA